MNEKKKRIVVAMSGGVDSSVVACLLKEQGHEVIGISMRLWTYEKEAKHGCCTPEDLYDARRVADHLGIPYYVTDFEKTFERDVVEQFVQGYIHGETPNPCVRCNQDIKFSILLERAQELGADYLATGHYARKVELSGGRVELHRALDHDRDQSYFLYGMTQDQLSQTIFPLGEMTKSEVRDIAQRCGLKIAQKPDSQEICFVPDNYAEFVEKRVSSRQVVEGSIKDKQGNVLGHHQGIHRYTVGQRKGLSLQTTLPMYVVSIEKDGDIIVGDKKDLQQHEFQVRELRWTQDPPKVGDFVHAKIRSRFEPAQATIEKVFDDQGISKLVARFTEPQESISPGQAAVFYQGSKVLGGGFIDRQ
ncbi:MAG: tRNA 2-thiouridine(34) synthase MnmA [Bdellovibrionota bacterium]